ncbi:hypothetical protein RDABS01_035167 [Bienertia sinuspersici]
MTFILSLNGFSCSSCLQYQDSRADYFVYMNSASFNFQIPAKFQKINSKIAYSYTNFHGLAPKLKVCCIDMHSNGSKKLRKFVNLQLMFAGINHGLVSEHGDTEVESQGKGKGKLLASNLGSKLHYLEERNERELSKRILGLSRTNKPTSALQLFRSMECAGLLPHLHLHACNSLLACLSRNDMLDDMISVFAIMRRHKIISGHSCSIVLKAVAKYHGSNRALQMFDEWQVESEIKHYFDAIVYNTVISICGMENRWAEMERIWEAMKENGNIGTEVTYHMLVCTFVRCGQYEIAIDAYAEMLKNQILPGYDAMHAVIGAYSKEEKWDLALNVFQSMLKRGLKPNLIACNALINSLGKAGKLKEAFQVYKHMESFGHTPDSYTWNALLTAFYRANQYADALQFFDSIQKDWGFEPNLQLYNTALMCCQRLGFWDNALQFLWKMENSGACEVGRKPKVALQVYEHMVHRKCAPDTFTRLSLIRSCIWGDQWDEVEEILEESTPNVSLYNAAIHGMCLRGRVESGKRLYMRMRDNGLVPDGKTRALMLQYMRKKST